MMSDIFIFIAGYFVVRAASEFESNHMIAGCFAILVAILAGVSWLFSLSQTSA